MYIYIYENYYFYYFNKIKILFLINYKNKFFVNFFFNSKERLKRKNKKLY